MLEGDIEVDEDCDRVRWGCGKLVGRAVVGKEIGCADGYEGEIGEEIVEGGVSGQLEGAVGGQLGCC